jgi:hypothetical protein
MPINLKINLENYGTSFYISQGHQLSFSLTIFGEALRRVSKIFFANVVGNKYIKVV